VIYVIAVLLMAINKTGRGSSCPEFEQGCILHFVASVYPVENVASLLLSLLQFVGDVGMKLVMHFHQSSNIFGINRESLLLQVGGSCQGGGDIGLDGLAFKGEGKIGGLMR